MERLTHEADFGLEDWEETLFFVKSDPNGAYNIIDIAKYQGEPEFDEILKNVALRLAAYENTGLEPEEIVKIREDIENGYMKSTARRYGVPVDRLRELAEADREDAVHIGACGFCEYYQMDKFCCCPDWVEDGYAVIRKPKDYCTKFKKAGWVDEVWGENGCPSCPGHLPTALKAREQDG